MKESTIGCLAYVLAAVLIVGGVVVGNYIQCKNKTEKQGLECSWGLFQGCMVRTENGWIDYERLRYMGEYNDFNTKR